jgi:magnesium transporter
MPESRYYHISKDGILVPLATLAEVIAAAGKEGYVWLDYYQPTKEKLSELIEPFGLHPLSIEDCVDEIQIPKIDDYPGYTFMLFNAFHYSYKVLSIREADIFLGTDFLITVNIRGSQDSDFLKNIGHLAGLAPGIIRTGPAFLLHVILDQIVDQKFLAIETLEDELDLAEEEILSDLPNFKPATLLHLRRDLFALRKSLFHEREILVKISRKDCPYIPRKALLLYRDIYDHLTIFFELTETSRDVVTSLMEMYLSMLNNQMAQTANRTNLTVRRLTFITTIFMPLTLLAGIGGMSEWSMMTGPGNWRLAYPLFILVMVILAIINYFFLVWLERKDRKVDQQT